jgi:rhamnosyltransferase
LAFIPRLLKPGAKVVATFHSRDRFHEKWRWPAKAYLAFGEWAVNRFPHATIAVSHTLQLFCLTKFKRKAWHIPNGVELPQGHHGAQALKKFGLSPGGYFFALNRFVPVKAIEDALAAFGRLSTDMKFAVIGYAGANRSERSYESKLRNLASRDPRIVFTGKQTGEQLQELIANAYAMVHPSRVEGLSISVLEAMAHGKLVIMSDIPPNLELIDHSGIAYKVGDVGALEQAMQFAISDPKMVKDRGERARQAVKQLYSWDSVVNRTEAVYFSLTKRI